MTIILGIDPGSRKTGFGVVEQKGGVFNYISSGCIKLEGETSFAARLNLIFDSVTQIIATYDPSELAIEEVFMGKNASSALKLGQARGVAMVACTQRGVLVSEYATRKVKQAITGNGNADKIAMQHMVKTLLKLPGTPQEDAADALALAICHGQTRTNLIHSHSGKTHFRRGRNVMDVKS